MTSETHKVSSELHEELGQVSKTSTTNNNVITTFEFEEPPKLEEDSEGDLIVPRKPTFRTIEIEHSKSTELNLVGLQMWRGSLLLADWLLTHGEKLPKDSTVLELGSGVGFASIVASIFRPVLITDIAKGGILDLIDRNLKRNSSIVANPFKIAQLDFTLELPEHIKESLSSVETLIASDVVYDDHLTEAFVTTLGKLLAVPPKKSAYVALEKRYVFTVPDFETAAPCYEHFLDCLRELKGVSIESVPLDFPQFFAYNRLKELVMWKISTEL